MLKGLGMFFGMMATMTIVTFLMWIAAATLHSHGVF